MFPFWFTVNTEQAAAFGLVMILTMQNGGMESASFGAIFRGLEEVLSELGAAAES